LGYLAAASPPLWIIAGVERADAGEVRIDGRLVEGPGVVPPEARSVGLMFQDFALFPHLTVAENVGFGLRGDRGEKARRVNELIEKVDLSGFGQNIRMSFQAASSSGCSGAGAGTAAPCDADGRAVLGSDNRLRDGIRDRTLELLKEEGAAVLVTHEPDEAMRMADEIALMRAGRIVQGGAPYNVYNAPVDRAAAAFFSDINVIRGFSKGALTQTPFGAFLTPGHKDGAMVEIVIRPSICGSISTGVGAARTRRPKKGCLPVEPCCAAGILGRESLVDFAMDFEGAKLTASVPGVFLPKPGTVLWLMIRRIDALFSGFERFRAIYTLIQWVTRKTPFFLPVFFCLAFVFLFRPRLTGAGWLTLFAESGQISLVG
jgi:iron(III) transport system ATP-binding protein